MNQIVPDRVGVFDDVPAVGSAGAQPGLPSAEQAAAPPPHHAKNQRVLGTPAPPPRHTQNRPVSGTPAPAVHPSFLLQPLHDRVLVRRSHEQGSVGLIIVPDVSREKALRGVVVAVGPGKKDADGVFRETMVRPGDVVIFSASVNVPYADLVEDGDLVMMAEADILGIVS
jgi:chaperonin GroES